jgi:hypothetical protein
MAAAANTTLAAEAVGGYTPFPAAFSWIVCACASTSLAACAFIVAAVPCRGFSIVNSPYSLVLAQALFEVIFAAALLANIVVTEPGVLSTLGFDNDYASSGTTGGGGGNAVDAAVRLCRAWPVLGALLCGSLFGAEAASILLTFDLRGFASGPFGGAVQCCRAGLYVRACVRTFMDRPRCSLLR